MTISKADLLKALIDYDKMCGSYPESVLEGQAIAEHLADQGLLGDGFTMQSVDEMWRANGVVEEQDEDGFW